MHGGMEGFCSGGDAAAALEALPEATAATKFHPPRLGAKTKKGNERTAENRFVDGNGDFVRSKSEGALSLGQFTCDVCIGLGEGDPKEDRIRKHGNIG